MRHCSSVNRALGSCAAALALPVLIAGLYACGRNGSDQPRVVLYVSADDYLARQVIQAFQDETGVRVDMVGDTEATKTTGLANRIRAEADNPQADVFWSSECFMMIQIANEGVLAPYESAATKQRPDRYRGGGNLWFGFGLRARVMVYAPDRVSRDELPRSWMAIGAERWRGRIAIADPRFGTTRGHMGAMKAFWDHEVGPEAFQAWIENLAYIDPQVLASGNAGVVQAVASGEADLGFTDTDDVWAAQEAGAKVDLIYPGHGLPGTSGAGTLLIPNTVARVKGGPNEEAAGKLIDFLLSPTVERMLAESDSHNIPVHDELRDEFAEMRVDDPLEVDLEMAAAAMDDAVKAAMAALSKEPVRD